MKADIKCSCPHCHQHLEAPADLAGQAVECPGCGKQIIVPSPESDASKHPATQRPRHASFPYPSPVPDAASDQNAATLHKACPLCGEQILSVAKKCKHCGEFVDSSNPEALNPCRPLRPPRHRASLRGVLTVVAVSVAAAGVVAALAVFLIDKLGLHNKHSGVLEHGTVVPATQVTNHAQTVERQQQQKDADELVAEAQAIEQQRRQRQRERDDLAAKAEQLTLKAKVLMAQCLGVMQSGALSRKEISAKGVELLDALYAKQDAVREWHEQAIEAERPGSTEHLRAQLNMTQACDDATRELLQVTDAVANAPSKEVQDQQNRVAGLKRRATIAGLTGSGTNERADLAEAESKLVMLKYEDRMAAAAFLDGVISRQKTKAQFDGDRLVPGEDTVPTPPPVPTTTSSPALPLSRVQIVTSAPPESVQVGQAVNLDLGGGVILPVVWVPPGEFDMGDALEKPIHHVRIGRGFWMGRYEVTQEQWQQVMGRNPSYYTGKDNPVEQVSWNDCQEFIQKLNEKVGTDRLATQGAPKASRPYLFRLPSEAEWEYACRAGSKTRFYTGNETESVNEAAWHGNNSGGKTHPVGQKKPNAWGLYDMHGNVMEWCQDWYGPYESDMATDPLGPPGGRFRVCRGGNYSWVEWACNSTDRFGLAAPSINYDLIGFRVTVAR